VSAVADVGGDEAADAQLLGQLGEVVVAGQGQALADRGLVDRGVGQQVVALDERHLQRTLQPLGLGTPEPFDGHPLLLGGGHRGNSGQRGYQDASGARGTVHPE
jgi:hypothetical protein